ncbi:MAG: hypothetical protein FWH27_12475 [Planctomycetaceae bacterium]|nr:hypothetical protein [Planctomycetaceae bacterium]
MKNSPDYPQASAPKRRSRFSFRWFPARCPPSHDGEPSTVAQGGAGLRRDATATVMNMVLDSMIELATWDRTHKEIG